MRKKLLKWLALGALLGVVAAVTFVLGVAEVRYFAGYQLMPESTRDAAFDKYTTPTGTTVYHLGTIHGQHFTNEGFGLGHLEAVIMGLRPDLLAVEVRPREMEADNPATGPVEMPIVTLIAQREGIALAGIDWWSEEWLLGEATEDRDDEMFASLRAALPAQGTVLVLTGYSHLLEFRSRYLAAGFTPEGFADSEKERLFAGVQPTFTLPAGLDESLARGSNNASSGPRVQRSGASTPTRSRAWRPFARRSRQRVQSPNRSKRERITASPEIQTGG